MFQDLKNIRWGHWAMIGGIAIAGAGGVYLLYEWRQAQNAVAAQQANAAEQQSLGIPAAELPGEALSDNELEDGIDLGEGIGGSSLVPTIGQSTTTNVGTVTEPSGGSQTVSTPTAPTTPSDPTAPVAPVTTPTTAIGSFGIVGTPSTALAGGTLETVTTPDGDTIQGVAGPGFVPIQVGNVNGSNNDVLFADPNTPGGTPDILWTQSTTDPTQFVDAGNFTGA
jgi:hypothetical protein